VGVAGIHRLFKHALLRKARVIIVVQAWKARFFHVAGVRLRGYRMPTSVGYGAALAAVCVLTMLNSCSTVATFNIDKGWLPISPPDQSLMKELRS